MTPALHAQAKSIFLEACRLPGAERRTFIRQRCAGNHELVAEVESLMAFYSRTGETTGASGLDARDTFASAATSAATSGSDAGDHPPTRPAALPAGHLYAGRYRVVELLGAGGMGEVYRAHDTVLDVPVALKRVLRTDPGQAAQVVREVRLARQITHRAVCRVFDVGETHGEHYFTMEYVDGEDLGTLLRRIGRLPAAKVIALARQLCAGLAAAHAQGILHRDLKPANIMIDRRGDARLTDFGIATLQERGGLAADRHVLGTPAYMAPEQFQGQPASPQSDLYALGLVLYELVTGRHALASPAPGPAASSASDAYGARDVRDAARYAASAADGERKWPPPVRPPSALVPDVDPQLEQIILRALDPDPSRRPSSAIVFSAALPGGDLLEAALEAGQTPSPELVASAGETGRVSARVGFGLLAIATAGIAIIVSTARVRLIDQVPIEDPPAVLAAQARTFLRDVTGEPTAAHHTYALEGDAEYLRRLADSTDAKVDPLRVARFVYREEPEPIVPALLIGTNAPFEVTLDNPPMTEPGTKAIVLDPRGRLRQFRTVPGTGPIGPKEQAADWTPFLRASGIDPASLAADTPRGPAPPFGEQRVAWRNASVHIEAASTRGRPTWFVVRAASEADQPPLAHPDRVVTKASTALSIVLLGAALVMARRNLQRGRGDVRGTRRVAVAMFVCLLGSWLLGATFLSIELEFARFLIVCCLLLATSLLTASFYLAFEPFVRRRWPSSLISWSRLLGGRFRDPIVGRDILIGAAASIAGTAIYHLMLLTSPGLRGDRPSTVAVAIFMGLRHLLSALLAVVPEALSSAMVSTLLYSLIVMLLRRGWIAGPVFLACLTIPILLQFPLRPLELFVLLVALSLLVIVFVRFGLLALVSYTCFDALFARFPLSLTGDWRTEFAVATLFAAGTVLALAVYTAVGGQPLRPALVRRDTR
jgi:eukaryotic-like serine/threonine-protein kinase